MRLAEFIRFDMEGILTDWEAFAADQLPGAAGMRPLELRDNAQQILEAVAKDIGQPQTSDEQSEKSKGRALRLMNARRQQRRRTPFCVRLAALTSRS